MVVFHCYVRLPEGNHCYSDFLNFSFHDIILLGSVIQKSVSLNCFLEDSDEDGIILSVSGLGLGETTGVFVVVAEDVCLLCNPPGN